MSKALMTNPSALLGFAFCAAETDVTAGGSGDATEVNGAWIAKGSAEGIAVAVAFTADLDADETLTLEGNLQDASDISGTGAADHGTAVAATTVATGGAGGTTETGVAVFDFPVQSADDFVRIQFTPNLSRGATDTANITAFAILGPKTDKVETIAGMTRLN